LFRAFFLFHASPPSATYTLSLHDALPISSPPRPARRRSAPSRHPGRAPRARTAPAPALPPPCRAPASRVLRESSRPRTRAGGQRSEEHTSELQSRENLVCRLLLEKKNKNT